jgi:hypothetical protein
LVEDLGSALELYLGLPEGSLGRAAPQNKGTLDTGSEAVAAALADGAVQPLLAPESPAQARGRALPGAFTALLRLEGVRGFDLFDAGSVARAADASAPAGAGPVVLRRFDAEGRLAGHLYARRLTLSGSRSGHTLSLHLEDGHSSTGGLRQPFADGRWTLPLRHVDPGPFLTAFPELFVDAPAAVPDDGRYPKAWLQYTFNRLLAEDPGGSRFQLAWFEGVAEESLRGVELVETDAAGRELRRLFADRLRLEFEQERVVLSLEQGVSRRGGESMPFLDGRLKLYFPRADVARWRSSGLPGTHGSSAAPEPTDRPALDPAGGPGR